MSFWKVKTIAVDLALLLENCGGGAEDIGKVHVSSSRQFEGLLTFLGGKTEF